MGIYRNIQISFWTDVKIVDTFTPEDKYFYLYLLTNPHSNLCGCYEFSIKQASDETGYSRDTIINLISRFKTVHKVIDFDEQTREILVINWSRYNWTKSTQFIRGLEKEIDKVKNDIFRKYLTDIMEEKQTVYIPSTDGIQTTVSVSVTDTVTDTVIFTDMNNKSSGNTTRKPKAEKKSYGKFENVLLTDEEYEKLRAAFPDYEEKIDDLSIYLRSKGKKYKDHYATILAWARRDKKENSKPQQNKVAQDLDNFYAMVTDWAQGEDTNG